MFIKAEIEIYDLKLADIIVTSNVGDNYYDENGNLVDPDDVFFWP